MSCRAIRTRDLGLSAGVPIGEQTPVPWLGNLWQQDPKIRLEEPIPYQVNLLSLKFCELALGNPRRAVPQWDVAEAPASKPFVQLKAREAQVAPDAALI